jgi:hypothetical protein
VRTKECGRRVERGRDVKRLLAADWSSLKHFLSPHTPKRQSAGSRYHFRGKIPLKVLRSAGWAASVTQRPAESPWGEEKGGRFRRALPVSYVVMYSSADAN